MRARRLGLAAVPLSLLVAACGLGSISEDVPSPPPVAQPSLSPTLQATRAGVFGALAGASIPVQDAAVEYRPGESAAVAAAPRHVLQAVLPDAPGGGFIVLYEFVDPTAAAAAGQEWAEYIASGIGRVQFPTDSVFTIRQDGAALVFHSWSPGNTADPEGEAGIASALAGIGVGWPVSP